MQAFILIRLLNTWQNPDYVSHDYQTPYDCPLRRLCCFLTKFCGGTASDDSIVEYLLTSDLVRLLYDRASISATSTTCFYQVPYLSIPISAS